MKKQFDGSDNKNLLLTDLRLSLITSSKIKLSDLNRM